jgi:hypothetical protein
VNNLSVYTSSLIDADIISRRRIFFVTLSDVSRGLMREYLMLLLFLFSKCTLFQQDVFFCYYFEKDENEYVQLICACIFQIANLLFLVYTNV